MPPTYVILGASLAGGTAAATLRQEGFDGEVILIGDEGAAPYERPPLSKQYLRGEIPFQKALVRPAGFYEQSWIDMLLNTRVSSVGPAQRVVQLSTGRQIRYDKLLIATGVRNRRPRIPGIELAGVFDLRTVRDAEALRNAIAPGRRAVVVGMGFIGCEVAASLRAKKVEVVGIDPSPTPLFRVLGSELGGIVASIHREHGVTTMFNDRVARFGGSGHVACVVTESGRRVDCDFVVLGVGVEPEVDFLVGSGIAVENGVLVDQYCQANVEHVYAAGDVANHYHPVAHRRMRVEHWQNAMQQGAAAARSMLGTRVPYDPVHWFWSDQYDINLQYAGFHSQSAQPVVRGSVERREFISFYLNEESRIEGVVALNRGKDVRRAMPLIKARIVVNRRNLEDDNVDLRHLLPAEAAGTTS